MADLLHPVSDGSSIGDLRVIGSGVGGDRFSVLTPILGDDRHVTLVVQQGHGFDQRMQARGPISFGEAVIRGRFARRAGDGGIELAIMVWGEDPRRATTPDKLIAQTRNFTIWHSDWQEYSLALVGRQADLVAMHMGDLWIRVVAVSAVGGKLVPTLGVSALWLEVPKASSLAFADPATAPANTFVTVRTFSGRMVVAKKIGGEWYDELGRPLEADRHSLPIGADGKLQESRGVNGWGS